MFTGNLFSGVSVVLPVWFREHTSKEVQLFLRALDSIEGQAADCPIPIEVIILDDSNPPISAKKQISDAIKSSKIAKYIYFENRQTLVQKLNFGVNSSSFMLIARLDADDAWRPSKLVEQIERFKGDPDLTIIGGGMRLNFESDQSKDKDIIRKGGWTNILSFMVSDGCPFPHGSIMARKDIFQSLGLYSHHPLFRHCEDFELWARWVPLFKADNLERIVLDYTVSDTQVSAVHKNAQTEGSRFVHERILGHAYLQSIPDLFKELSKLRNESVLATGLWLARRDFVKARNLPGLEAELVKKILFSSDFHENEW